MSWLAIISALLLFLIAALQALFTGQVIIAVLIVVGMSIAAAFLLLGKRKE